MSLTFNCLHALEFGQLWKESLKESCFIKESESDGRLGSDQYLVQFLHYTFLGQDRHAVEISFDGIERFLYYMELLGLGRKLCGKPYGRVL